METSHHRFRIARRRLEIQIKLWLWMSVMVTAALASILGCSPGTSNQPIENSAVFEPEFFDATQAASDSDPDRETSPFAFLTDNYFMAVAIRIAEMRNHPDFSTVDWPAMESLLANIVGSDHVDLGRYSRVWLLIPKRMMSPEMLGVDSEQLLQNLMIVVECDQPFAIESLPGKRARGSEESADQVSESDLWELSVSPMFARQINETTLAIGGRDQVGGLSSGGQGRRLLDILEGVDMSSTLVGAVDFRAVTATLNSLATMAKQFGAGETMNDILAVDSARWSGHITGDELFELTVTLDDPAAVSRVAQMIDSSMNNPRNMSGPIPGGPSRFEMFPIKSSDAVAAWFEELQSKNLARMTKSETSISLVVERGESYPALVAALIHDIGISIRWNSQVAKMQQVAEAVDRYCDKHGCFPVDGPLSEGSEHAFSWRVAILPELDRQDLFDQFRFDEPCDSEHNRAVASRMPEVFQTAGFGAVASTTIRSANGPDAVFAITSRPLTEEAIQDRKNGTALFLLLADSEATSWQAADPALPPPGESARYLTSGALAILLIDADRKVRAIKNKSDVLGAYLTAAGGEPVQRSESRLLSPEKSE